MDKKDLFTETNTIPITSIMKTREYPDSVFYKAECSCGSHDKRLILELDEDGIMSLTIYVDMGFYDASDHKNIFFDFFKRWWKRIKMASSILFLGRAEFEEDFIFHGERAIEDYIIALDLGLEKLKKTKKEYSKYTYVADITKKNNQIEFPQKENEDET